MRTLKKNNSTRLTVKAAEFGEYCQKVYAQEHEEPRISFVLLWFSEISSLLALIKDFSRI